MLPTGPSTSLQPENGQMCSSAPASSSQPSSSDSSSLCSPQLSPQVSPDPQLADLLSDGHSEDRGVPATSSAPLSKPQGSSAGGEQEAEDAKEAKSAKKQHLHCPTCKVTVNSSSQLEAHCSGVYYKALIAPQLKVPYYKKKILFPNVSQQFCVSEACRWTPQDWETSNNYFFCFFYFSETAHYISSSQSALCDVTGGTDASLSDHPLRPTHGCLFLSLPNKWKIQQSIHFGHFCGRL